MANPSDYQTYLDYINNRNSDTWREFGFTIISQTLDRIIGFFLLLKNHTVIILGLLKVVIIILQI